jgi:hypothetical protein
MVHCRLCFVAFSSHPILTLPFRPTAQRYTGKFPKAPACYMTKLVARQAGLGPQQGAAIPDIDRPVTESLSLSREPGCGMVPIRWRGCS